MPFIVTSSISAHRAQITLEQEKTETVKHIAEIVAVTNQDKK